MGDLVCSACDLTNPDSIEKYAQRLIGHTFKDVEDFYSANQFIQEETKRDYNPTLMALL